MKITDFALENRTSVFVLMFLIVVAGMFAYIILPRESAPDIEIPYVFITTFYEGVSPSDMETLVTMKIEKELAGLKDVKEMRSSSIEGFSTISIEFEPDVDIDDALQKVRDKVDLAQPELPQDMEDEPVVTEMNFADMPIILVNVSGGDDLARLTYIGEELQDRIEMLPGVLRVDISGDIEREIRLEFDPDRLAAYELDVSQAIAAVSQNNLNVPSGSLELGSANYNVKVPGEFEDPDEIDNIVIDVRDGRPVYLLDVAKVVDGYEERATYSRLNGEPTVTLSVVKRSGENIIHICDMVRELLAQAEEQLPEGVLLTTTADQSEDIRMMVQDLENNILSGLLLIMVVIFIALGWRDAVLVALAIPFSMLISFSIIYTLGITLNMVVLFSLTLSLGMLVDNAIVIVENIHRHHQQGLRRIQAAHVATREVAWPITTSCLTTVCAFFPMLFWPGIMGEFMGYLPKTVIITLASSLFVALIITPCVAAVLLKKQADPEKHKEDVTEKGLVQLYQKALVRMIRYRWATVVLALGSLFVMIHWFSGTGLGTQFFPEPDPNRGSIRVELPEGASLDASDKIVRVAERAAMRYPECEAVVASVGATSSGDITSGGGGATPNKSQVTIEFVDREDRNIASRQVIKLLREDLSGISGAEIFIEKAEEGPPTGKPVAVELSGPDFRTLGTLAREVRGQLKAIDGLVGIEDDYITSKPELEIRVDKEKAALMGLTTQMIGNMIRTSVQGAKAGVYRVGNDEYDVIVQMPKSNRSEVDTIQRLRIPNLVGQMIPLSSVAEITWSSSLGQVTRVDERRTVTVTAEVAEGLNENALLAQAKSVLKRMDMPEEYAIQFGGQNEEQEESQAFLGKAFLAAIGLIALVLVMQFDSVILPFIILTSVILSLIGVFLGLILTSTPFGIIMTGIGVISLAGVVVNNAIVLIDYIEMLRRDGMELHDAVVRACSVRFRPVVLTAITTVLGLLPMALGISMDFRTFQLQVGTESSEWWGPMAVAVIFGLGVATILTLGVLPSLYVILARLRGQSHRAEEKEDTAISEPEQIRATPAMD